MLTKYFNFFYNIIKNIEDSIFGNIFIRNFLINIIGYRWNGWMLGFFADRAIHMVGRDETCLLGGIYDINSILNVVSVVGKNGKIIVVEANPKVCEDLVNQTKQYANVKIINRAIWEKKGKMEFICSTMDKTQGYNRLDSPDLQEFPLHIDGKPEKILVKTDTLPNIIKELDIKKIDHINLTINGAEFQSLKGLAEIKKQNPALRVYINSETPDPAVKVINGLKEIGFKVFTSHLIRVVNKKIKLVRIYACNS